MAVQGYTGALQNSIFLSPATAQEDTFTLRQRTQLLSSEFLTRTRSGMADQGVTRVDQAPLTDNLGIGLTARAALSLQRGQSIPQGLCVIIHR